MLKVKDLSKKYEKVLAVNKVSFEIDSGEIGVLIGPNGAGKSTTIKSIAGLLRFEGEITIDGKPNKSIEAKRIFGYVPESPSLYDSLSVWDHLEFVARAYKLQDWTDTAEELLARFDMDDKKKKIGKDLSKGMQQKVSICCALLIKPRMVMFDEPMIGLDPKAIKELKEMLLELKASGCAILISTHILDSIADIWDKALIMNKGEIVFNNTRDVMALSGESLEHIFFSKTEEEVAAQ
ncbi:MAG TPA: ABC transporter ATP-binding protein [Clostridiaceae bacterium]|jgi:ABC-2 type transport system ATP-binding protein|nr:ABC transporter ATP-binding protein [Clostridiaceae bacterium]